MKNKKISSSCGLGCIVPILLILLLYAIFSSDSDSEKGYMSEARYACQETIKKHLLVPSTAKIKFQKEYQNGSFYHFSGNVKASNAFGVILTTPFSAVIEFDPAGDRYRVSSFKMGDIEKVNTRETTLKNDERRGNEPTEKKNEKTADSDKGKTFYDLGMMHKFGLHGYTKDEEKAFLYFLQGAEKGNANAMYQLALCYETGNGTIQSYPDAVEWHRVIAEQGNHFAQSHLAWCYITGKGLGLNYSEGVKWLRRAAEQGDTDAIFGLGVMYETGRGVKQDYTLAVEWYRKAAGIGHNLAEAQFFLGECYDKGLGVGRNQEEATYWWSEAARQSHFGAESRLNKCFPERDEYSGTDKPLRKATDLGGPFVQYVMMNFYFHFYCLGKDVQPDYSEAVAWLRSEAEFLNADPDVQYVLGKCYEFGDVVEKNEEEALKWYRKAAEKGNEKAVKELASREADENRKAMEAAEKDEKKNNKALETSGISAEWAKQYNLSDYDPDSDEDSDGFTLLQEYQSETDPTDSMSHPKYITQIQVSAISQQRFSGLELATVDMTKDDKKNWMAEFNVVSNNRKRTAIVGINAGTFKNNDIAFTLIDIEVDKKTREPIAFIQRVGKQERITCRPKQPVYDPIARVKLLYALFDRNIVSQVGSDIKLGTAKTGEEIYTIVSVDPAAKEVVVESTDKNKKRYTIKPRESLPQKAKDEGSKQREKTPILRRKE